MTDWTSYMRRWRRAVPGDLRNDPAFAVPTVDEGLPFACIVGDSISMQYTPPVRDRLKARANVIRIPDYARTSREVALSITEWLGGMPWDVVHINFGLHDLVLESEPRGGQRPRVGLEEYSTNVSAVLAIVQRSARSAIWATTTPIPDGADRRIAGSEVAYNAAALSVATAAGLAVNDLWRAIDRGRERFQLPGDVHLTDAGADRCGRAALAHLVEALGVS